MAKIPEPLGYNLFSEAGANMLYPCLVNDHLHNITDEIDKYKYEKV